MTKLVRELNPRLTDTLFVTQLTKGGGYHSPKVFTMNHRMMVNLVPVVSVESPLNIDTKNKYQHGQRLAYVTS